MLHRTDNVIGPQGILATKARILVTNSIAFLQHFDQLVYVRHGSIVESGSLHDLLSDERSELNKLVYVRGFFFVLSDI
jgi:ATP-binding cassette subfamily C (CFTR/MRP) protein 1